MEFWKWYLKGIVQALRAIISPYGEYTLGCIFLVLGSILLSVWVSPLLLLLIIPAGITIAVHGFWRNKKNRR